MNMSVKDFLIIIKHFLRHKYKVSRSIEQMKGEERKEPKNKINKKSNKSWE